LNAAESPSNPPQYLGDTIRFKVLIRDFDGEDVCLPEAKEAKLSVRASTADQASIFEQTLPISFSGTLDGSFAIPNDATGSSYRFFVDGAQISGNTDLFLLDASENKYYGMVELDYKEYGKNTPITGTIVVRDELGRPVQNLQPRCRMMSADDKPLGDFLECPRPTDKNGQVKFSIPCSSSVSTGAYVATEFAAPDGKTHATQSPSISISLHDFILTGKVNWNQNIPAAKPFCLSFEVKSFEGQPITDAVVTLKLDQYTNKLKATPGGPFTATTDMQGNVEFRLVPDEACNSLHVNCRAEKEGKSAFIVGSLKVTPPDGLPHSSGNMEVTLQAPEKIETVEGKLSAVLGIRRATCDAGKPFTVFLTAENTKSLWRQVVRTTRDQEHVDIPLSPDFAPGFTLTAILFIGENIIEDRLGLDKNIKKKEVKIAVAPVHRQLQIRLQPKAGKSHPAATIALNAKVLDWKKHAVGNAELFAVVCDVGSRRTPDVNLMDPWRYFLQFPHAQYAADVYFEKPPTWYEEVFYLGPKYAWFYPWETASDLNTGSAFGHRGSGGRRRLIKTGGGESGLEPLRPPAFWGHSFITDKHGKVSFEFTIPAGPPTWRIFAAAFTADSRFGCNSLDLDALFAFGTDNKKATTVDEKKNESQPQ
jgi:hypothetical protein